MSKETDESKVEQPFRINEGYDIFPYTLIGVKCNWENVFVDWLVDKSIEENIDPDKEPCPHTLFKKIAKLKDVELPLSLFVYWEGIYTEDDGCIVGVCIDAFDERKSIKRMKIEVFNDLVKIGLLNDRDKLDWIRLHTDMIIYDKKILEEEENNAKEE
jgi:hypothetical protein